MKSSMWRSCFRAYSRMVSPLHVAAYIRTHPGSAPTVKQHLAAIRFARVSAVIAMRRQDYLPAGEPGVAQAPREGRQASRCPGPPSGGRGARRGSGLTGSHSIPALAGKLASGFAGEGDARFCGCETICGGAGGDRTTNTRAGRPARRATMVGSGRRPRRRVHPESPAVSRCGQHWRRPARTISTHGGRVAGGAVHLPAAIGRREVAELCASEQLVIERGAAKWVQVEGRANHLWDAAAGWSSTSGVSRTPLSSEH